MQSGRGYLKKDQRFRESDLVFNMLESRVEGKKGEVQIESSLPDSCTAPFVYSAGESGYSHDRRNGYSCT